MKSDDYAQGDAFQAEKRSVFSTQWLPLCAERQVANAGDFLSATVGGWGVVAVRDKADDLRVLRNACRHQNMPVVGTPAGNCDRFRCRFHGWTYDLAGKFIGAPPPVAPSDPPPGQSADLGLHSLATVREAGLLFFSIGNPASAPRLGALPAYGGTLTTDIAGNWKVVVEHLLGERRDGSADFDWHWPLLAVRRAGELAIVEQIMPQTFLRTRLLTHVFGGMADDHKQAAATIKHACERLQADRAAGTMAANDGALLAEFRRRLASA
jgi:nitrite reductase/ring-hydroxylating ferredoxin subunit